MFKKETKTCQNCKTDFTIEPEDFEFYEKIDVPAPTFCPECRSQRRMTWRNERKLHKRKSSYSGKEIVSIYNEKSPFNVYETKIYNSDKWDAINYGIDYDFNKSFFEQFRKLLEKIPSEGLRIANSVNCNYCNTIINSKNCYMCGGINAENCYYVGDAFMSKYSINSFSIYKSEKIFEGIDIDNSYNLKYCIFCDNCIDSAFLYNCKNCQNCFGCTNLRHKKYHIFNKSYTKIEYEKEIKKYDLRSYKEVKKIKSDYKKFSLKFPRAWARIVNSIDTTGDIINNSKNCRNCFNVRYGAEDCKYIFTCGLGLKDSYDLYAGGAKTSFCYDSDGILGGQNINFSDRSHESYNLTYCVNSFNSHDLFGCTGLRHKQYCILNKQYTKESFDKLRTKIIQHMNDMPYIDKKGNVYKYGEFFPAELSPFGYNETIANEYFPLTKEQALKQGYVWYNKPKSEYKPTIKAINLPDGIKDVDDKILKEIIECSSKNCAGSSVFRIIPQELKFYQKQNLPLPRLCPDCRHQERIKQRNPLKLWHRKCMKKGCNTEFETSYSPERKEIVYCEECYLKEIG